MGADMVPANKATFSRIRDKVEAEEGGRPSVEALAGILGGVSRTVMTNMLAGGRVSYGRLVKQVMPALGHRWPGGIWDEFSLNELIQEDVESRIPNDPKLLRKFVHGYYEDHNRSRLGAIEWFEEKLTVKAAGYDESENAFVEGIIKNQHKEEFKFTLNRLSDHLCVFHAIHQGRPTCFAGTFTHLHRGMLCGVWCGINLAWRPSTYRSLLSSTKVALKPRELNAICKSIHLFRGSKGTR